MLIVPPQGQDVTPTSPDLSNRWNENHIYWTRKSSFRFTFPGVSGRNRDKKIQKLP